MKKDDFLDEVHRILHETEKIIRSKKLKETSFFTKNSNEESLTVRDIYYQEEKIHQYDINIKEKVESILDLFAIHQKNIEELKEIIFDDNYDREIYNLVIKAIAKKPYIWKEFIEREFINAVDEFKKDFKNISAWEIFLDLTEFLPTKFYEEKSDFYQKILSELISNNSCLTYWMTIIIWKKGYTNSLTIKTLKKNLNHSDWRIRIISHECLETWIKEGELQKTKFPDLTLVDKFRRKFYKSYELKLLTP